MAAKQQRVSGRSGANDAAVSFADVLNSRMVEARAGVVELADAAKLSKETIRRLRKGLAEPSEVTRRKLDDGFDLLAARRLATASSVVVTQDVFDEFRQRVAYTSSVVGRNAGAIEEGLGQVRQALTGLLAEVQTLRVELAALREELPVRVAERLIESAP